MRRRSSTESLSLCVWIGLNRPRDRPRLRAAIAGVIRAGESYGAVFAKGNRLRGPVNRAIAALRKDGTLRALSARWLTSDLPKLPVLR